jgi:alpha-beta hydrolase superfamily lysophospholipase
LPLYAERTPPGGLDEVMRLGYEDAVLKLMYPMAVQAAAEFPAALAALRDRFGLETGPGRGPLALVGGSLGAAVAGLVLTETAPAAGERVAAAVLASPLVQLRAGVEANGRRFGVTYPWSPPSLRAADRLDLVARADEIARVGEPAVQLIVGADDDRAGFLEPAQQLHEVLRARYRQPQRVDLVEIPGMGHAMAEEPGVDPAPQTPSAAVVDRHAAAWLGMHLAAASAVAERSGGHAAR